MSSPSPPSSPISRPASAYGIAGAYKPTRPTKRLINDYRYAHELGTSYYLPSAASIYSSTPKPRKNLTSSNEEKPKDGNGQVSQSKNKPPAPAPVVIETEDDDADDDDDDDDADDDGSDTSEESIDWDAEAFDEKIASRMVTPLFSGIDEKLEAFEELIDAIPDPEPPPRPKILPWTKEALTFEEGDYERFERIKKEIQQKREFYKGCKPVIKVKPKLKDVIIESNKRLSTHFKNKFEKIRDKVKVPGYYLEVPWPIWNDIDLSQKVPYFQDSLPVYVSRGKLCQELQLSTGKETFDLSDPYSRTRIPYQKYNSLHDPFCFRYFRIPYVRKQLRAQGLLTKSNDVVCSLKELNEFRHYIKGFENLEVLEKHHHIKAKKMQRKHVMNLVQRFRIQELEAELEAQRKRLPPPNPRADIIERYEKREAINKKLEDAEQRRQDVIRQQDDKFFKYRQREKEAYSRRLELKAEAEKKSTKKKAEMKEKWNEFKNKQKELAENQSESVRLQEEQRIQNHLLSLDIKEKQRKEAQMKIDVLRADRTFRIEQRRQHYDRLYKKSIGKA